MSANLLKNYIPGNWKNNGNDRFIISPNSDEFRKIEREFEREDFSLYSIERVENLKKWGQFLLSQKRLAITYPNTQYYLVKKYVEVPEDDVGNALKYNLDERRCLFDFDIEFVDLEDVSDYPEVVLIVNVITTDPDEEDFYPERDDYYYIEYIVKLD